MLPLDILRAELSTDPLARGYAAMSSAEAAASLRAVDTEAWEPVPVEQVKAWAVRQMTPGGQFLLKALKLAAADDQHPASGLADTLLEAVGVNMPAWRMDDAQNVSLMAAAVTAGFLTLEQIDALRALGRRTMSRAAALGLDESFVVAAVITRARNG
ncbi:MAG: hypothetical protein DCC73_14985 [Proteobacteria bacterium]|nr:MAG: hypothetical protein DCC73_14985 [Pseudomonadota bacterium]